MISSRVPCGTMDSQLLLLAGLLKKAIQKLSSRSG
jgi:hypothetical protein